MSQSVLAEEVVFSQTPAGPGNQLPLGSGGPQRGSVIRTGERSRRYTPYRKTPRSRNLAGKNQAKEDLNQESEEIDDYEGLLNKTWRVYRVSPLCNLQYSTQSFRKYSRALSSYILAEQRKGLGVEPNEQANTAVFSLYKGLNQADADKEAMQVLVKGKPKTGNGPARVVLTALLCGVGLAEDPDLDPHGKFSRLPIMLVQGPIRLADVVRQWLQCTFDCCCSPMHFSSVDQSWMVAMWAGSLAPKRLKPVELVYRVPAEVEGLHSITITVDARSCSQLWNKIHKDGSEEFSLEEVLLFIHALEHHIFVHFKIGLKAMPLLRVGTSIAMIGHDGKLKLFSGGHVKQVLQHLTEVAMER